MSAFDPSRTFNDEASPHIRASFGQHLNACGRLPGTAIRASRIHGRTGDTAVTEYAALVRAKPEYYRGKAEESRELSKRCDDPTTRANLLDVAEQYERLADKADREG